MCRPQLSAVKIVLLGKNPFWQVKCKTIAYENNDTYERREMLKSRIRKSRIRQQEQLGDLESCCRQAANVRSSLQSLKLGDEQVKTVLNILVVD